MDFPLASATAIKGLRAVFGEQYPDPVRVVTVGGPGVQAMIDQPDDEAWKGFSIEFCGGTHMGNSLEAKKFALLGEEGLGRGVRRIVGVTFEKAEKAKGSGKGIAPEWVGDTQGAWEEWTEESEVPNIKEIQEGQAITKVINKSDTTMAEKKKEAKWEAKWEATLEAK